MKNIVSSETSVFCLVRCDVIREAWQALSNRDKFLVTQRLAGRTLQSVGDELNVTRERVRQIQVAAQRRFIFHIRTLHPNWDEIVTQLNHEVLTISLRDFASSACDAELAAIWSNLIFDDLGWTRQTRDSGWWIRDKARIHAAVRGLLFDEPLRRDEWLVYVEESGLRREYVDYLLSEKLLPIESYQGFMISLKRARRDRVHVHLLVNGRSHIRDIAAALGEAVPRNLDAFMSRQDVFAKLFPSGEWALAEFAEVKYKKAMDVVIDVLSDHGPMSIKELSEKVTNIFPVSHGRVIQCLDDFRIGSMPDGKVWLVEHGARRKEEPEPKRPKHISCSGGIIGVRREVDGDTLRGSGLMDHKWLAWKLGLESTPMEKVFLGTAGLPEMRVTRAGGNSRISSIREAVLRSRVQLGCILVILLDMSKSTWEIRHACEKRRCPAAGAAMTT